MNLFFLKLKSSSDLAFATYQLRMLFICQTLLPLTFLLAALLKGLLATFASVLAAELHNADGEEDCQNPKADNHAHRS